MEFQDKVILGEDGLFFTLPKVPDEQIIDGYQLASAKQKFKRQIFPSQSEYEKLSRESRLEIQTRELMRRTEGYWFFNHGVPTYLTGSHYFYLNYWYMAAITEDGMPDYRWAQTKWGYMYELCEQDELCFGAIMMSGKRFSKTEFGLAHLYNIATRGGVRNIGGRRIPDENALFGMQSLKGEEAKKNLFKSRIIRSHRRIPNYLKPRSNDSIGKGEIASELTFFGEKQGDNVSEALNNIIDWRPTNESAYQGKRPREVYWDEPATMEEMNIEEALTTLKQQLQIGKRAFGKLFMPATVESMLPKGAPLFQRIWKESNPAERDANGRTQSWLYRYFNPHHEGREDFIDEYGNSLNDEAKQFRANEIAIAKPDKQKKIKRQYPESVDEAFDVIVSNFWEADVQDLLSECRKRLMNSKSLPIKKLKLLRVGEELIQTDLARNSDDTAVSIFEDPRAHVNYYASFDGVASDKETGNQEGSKVSVTILKGADASSNVEYLPVAYFEFRPQRMEDGYRATANLCRLYGQFGKLKLGIERNAGQGSPLIAFMINQGLRKMLMKKQRINGISEERDNSHDRSIYGWYRNAEVIDVQRSYANSFLRRFAQNIPFLELIESLIEYGRSNQDFAVSFIGAVYTMGDIYNKKQAPRRVVPTTRWKYFGIKLENGRTVQDWRQVPVR